MPPDPRVNILLVDDQPNNLLALEAILEGLGQNLVLARSGTEALRSLLEDDFAVILMDIEMPDMDGFEVAAWIRQRDKSRHTPIIFLTAYQHNDVHIARGYSLGAVDYLFKPIMPEVLRSKVSVFVELFQKTEQVKRQAELLRENQRHEHERALAEERRRWEVERLRDEAAREKKIAEERAQLLARERAARAEAEAANRAKDEFLSIVSHELRTPLTPILLWSHRLRTKKPDEATTARALEMIERSAKAQAQIVDDLLDVSWITAGMLRLDLGPVDLAAVVLAALEIVRPTADAKGIRLESTVHAPAGPVWADSRRLQQVVWNLLSNAIKFTSAGGRVEVRLEPLRVQARITVSDTGAGIPADFLPHVFDRFRQAASANSRAHGGLGLGLAIVKHLVGLHGGTVAAESPGEGQGARFIVELPVARNQAEGAARPGVIPAPGDRPQSPTGPARS